MSIRASARDSIEQHDIRTPSENTPISNLSGGNIQKVLLARELSRHGVSAKFKKWTGLGR